MISLLVVATGAALQPCSAPIVIDGDTIVCGHEYVRLAVIDAPELPGHCRVGRACEDGNGYASKAALTNYLHLVTRPSDDVASTVTVAHWPTRMSVGRMSERLWLRAALPSTGIQISAFKS